MFLLRPEVELLKHQVEFLEIFPDKKVFGLFDKPGLGKTLEILSAICQCLVPNDKALVVCPAYLIPTWEHEIEKFTYLELGEDIDVVAYTMLGKTITSFEGYDFIAWDEAHYIKNLEAKRTDINHVYMLENLPEYFIYATGTPITNRIPDIYSFLVLLSYYDFVTPNIQTLYNSYYKFCMRFCNVTENRYGGRNVMKFTGIKHADELREYLKPWTLRREFSGELPPMSTLQVVASYADDPALQLAWEGHIEEGNKDVKAKVGSAVAKASFTANYVDTLLESGDGPVVIFSDHREPVFKISDILSKKGWKVETVVGGGDTSKRSESVARIQSGESDVFVATYGSACEGITLTKARIIVFNDIPWTPHQLLQATKRILRISQTRDTLSIYINGSKIDGLIIADIIKKMADIDKVIEEEK